MYALGTTLIYTELAHAALAADLFGAQHLKSYGHIIGWEHGFVVAACSVYSGGDAEISERWELVLDTEEKVQWFVPKNGDTGYVYDSEGEKKHGEFRGGDIIANTMTLFNSPSHMISFLMFSDNPPPVIEKRQGKPFPTPQEVRHD